MQDIRQLPKAEIVFRLKVFYQEVKILEQEPVFGHYEADLFPDQAESADQQAAPDDHYYQAQGEEPPPAKKRLWFRNNVELTVMLSCIAVLLLVLAFWPVGSL